MNPGSFCPDKLSLVQQLYDRDLFLQAWRAAEAIGPLRQWRGTAARLLAGRLARTLEAHTVGHALMATAYRQDRQDPVACYFYDQALALRPWYRPPLGAKAHCLQLLGRHDQAPGIAGGRHQPIGMRLPGGPVCQPAG